MDEDGRPSMRTWPYYEPIKETLGLQLVPSVMGHDHKPFHNNGGFLHRDFCTSGTPVSMEFGRTSFFNLRSKIMPLLPMNPSDVAVNSDASGVHAFQMMQQPEPLNDDRPLMIEGPVNRKDLPSKKKSQGRAFKPPKIKKPKKREGEGEASANRSVSRARTANRNIGLVINGIDLDISGIPTPVCSCTGTPQQCYRWGIGGWQSACCTTNINVYPLPMNVKKKGTRIAGRKMSQGAFKKVLEKLAGEGYNLSVPIDLKTYWAKHGTNKFVTIR